MKKFLIAAATAALSVGTAHAGIQQITLTPANVTAATASYQLAPGQFDAGNILDQQTGAITENQQSNYWINPDNTPGAAYLTIDLGKVYSLTSFDLFNTHNAQYNDRGTGAFQILGSNNNFATAGTVISSGTLAAASSTQATLTAQSFVAAGKYRYLQFVPLSVATTGTPCCGNSTSTVYGLNELRAFATVPEPATWAMMIVGFGLIGATMRRRSTKIAFA